MKTFLPLCTAILLLAISLPSSAIPSTGKNAIQRDEMESQLQLLENNLSRQVESTLREEMEILFRHLERELSGQVEDAALATVRQERRLTKLENELKQLQKGEESADAERRQKFSAFAAAEADKVKAASDRYTSLISSCFTALSVVTALVLATPMFFGYFGLRSFNKEAESKLAEMDQKLTEMETLVAKGHQHEQELKQLLQRNNPPQEQEKFSADITQSAKKAVKKNIGVEALRGRAVLAQNAEDWRRACLYWEDVIKEDPSDKEARFFLAQCRTLLGSRGDVSPEQRTLLWKQAEDFYREELTGPPTPQQSNVLVAYAVLKREQAKFADANSRQHLYTEAEEFLRRSGAREDMYTLSLRATIKRALATLQSDTAKRADLCNEAEKLLLQARELAPQEVNLIGLLAELKLQQAADKSKPEERARLREEAGQLLLQARNLAPQDAKSYVVLAQLKAQQADEQGNQEECVRLREEAEQLLFKAMRLAPQDVQSCIMLAGLKRQQADGQDTPEKCARLWKEAERLLFKARKLAPQDTTSYVELAKLRAQQANKQSNLKKRTLLREEAENSFCRLRSWIQRGRKYLICWQRSSLNKHEMPPQRNMTASLPQRKPIWLNFCRKIGLKAFTTGPVSSLRAASTKERWSSWRNAEKTGHFPRVDIWSKTKIWTACAIWTPSRNFWSRLIRRRIRASPIMPPRRTNKQLRNLCFNKREDFESGKD